MNKLGKTISGLALALVLQSGAYAGSSYDGIYQCSMSALGSTSAVYIAVNTATNGSTGVFTVPYLSAGQSWDGYGVGTWSSNVLAGQTNYGGSFSANFSTNAISFTTQAYLNGGLVPATGSCSRII